MSIAENMLLGLIKQMGISPDDVKNVMGLVQRLHTIVSEVDGFKTGARSMVQHFDARFDRIEAALERLARERRPDSSPLLLAPESDTHGNDQRNGHAAGRVNGAGHI